MDAQRKFNRPALGSIIGVAVRAGLLAGAPLFAAVTWAAEPQAGITEMKFEPRSGPRGGTMFKVLAPQETSVVTENRYADPKMWAERYQELELGAVGTGVTVGDYDGDGRPDIFAVSKTESCRLFRNLGGWKFEDVTDRAGVADKGDAAGVWKQGATFVDVNNDGRLDIYLCRFASPNLLYINQGDGTFKEEALSRGLAVKDSSVMAAFCDYDRDGWLDVFIQTNLLDGVRHPKGQRDYLFRNNRDGTFSNVSERLGIGDETQGHSATWWDYDNDGWPDLYVANDFAPADILWRNNRDGTFTNVIDLAVPHTPFSSMGSDLGDVNNDGLIDLLVADMAATTHEKDHRTMAATRGLSSDPAERDALAAPQYLRNALYLGTGTTRCLEAAIVAGLGATDWTWSVRFEDLDNDGRLDLHVTNGMHRESHNTDLIARMTLAESQTEKVRIERASPVLAEPNLAFRNLGGLQFENTGAAWGLDEKGVSYGAAFGDLDGDGDLDLVYTNYQKGVTLLRNDSETGHRVIFALLGTQSNRSGVGATVRIETDSGIQIRQLVLARGVLSSSEPVLHFGLGKDTRLNQVTVSWPSGHTQTFADLEVDRKYTLTEPVSPASPPASTKPPSAGQFSEVGMVTNLAHISREIRLDESGQNPLLPMRQNRRGPSVAVGDADGDGLDDVFLGGTPTNPVRALIAGTTPRFTGAETVGLASNSQLNDGPILMFDADGDGANDLLVTKGGVALPAGSAGYQPNLFINDGHGKFRPAADGAVPPLSISAGAVVSADFDRNGRLDLFIGGRVVPGLYPYAPKSALWVNRGGRFEDVTDILAPGLRNVGMVTSALWSDADNDGWPDLLVALEWGHVKYFHNNQGKGLEDLTEKAGFGSAGRGWWSSLAAADFNGDGKQDYVAGNLGLNSQYHADASKPALLLSGDFKGDGALQLVEAYYEGDRLYPWRTRKELGAAIPSVMKRYPRNDYYSRATLGEILGEAKLAAADRFAVEEFRSGVFMSQTDGTYRFEALPRLAQISAIQGLVAGDFDGDGRADIYAVQNSYAPIPSVGRFDSGLSLLLRGDGHGHFAAAPPSESGLIVPGDAKALAVLDMDRDGWPDFLVTRNNSSSLAFRNNGKGGGHSLCVRLTGPAGNPHGVGARITVELADGSIQTGEIHAGSGYYSQSTAACFFGWTMENTPRKVRVQWPSGVTTNHDVPAQLATLYLSAHGP